MRTRIILGVLLSVTFASLALAQPLPVATFKSAAQDVLINDTFKFCVMFQNSGAAGYAPFIDLVLPLDPMNGNSPCDGISFVSATVTSTTPNVPLTAAPFVPTVCTAAATNITHPFSPQITTPTFLPAGQQLITMALPFGSYQLSQPNILIEVTAKIHPFADANKSMPITVRGGFRYGSGSGLGIVQSAWNTEIITPRAVIIEKQFLGKDNEMVPGPSMPQQFAISIHVAPTPQSVTNLTINDCLPPGGLWVVSGTPCMTHTWASLTGGSNPTITPAFMVGNIVGLPVCAKLFTNTSSITGGSWIPLDPNDPPPSLVSSASSSITIRALAIQKSAQVLNAAQPLPGGQIAYHLNFEVSDYLRFGDIVISDTLTDGQTYVLNSGTLTVSDRFGTVTVVPLDPFISPVVHNVSGNYVCPPPKDPCHPPIGLGGGPVPGGNRYTFNVSQAMIQHLPAAPPPLNLGVLSGPASTNLTANMTPAIGSIDFIVDITDAFSNQHGDDGKLSKDDPLYDDVQITGTRYSKLPALAPTPILGAICIDHGSSCLAVPSDDIHKEVFAVNGVPVTSNPLVPYRVKRGDVVTFHLWKTPPSGDAENLSVKDWFSQPVFDATPFIPGPVPVCSNTVVPLPTGTTCYTAPPTVATPVLTVNASDNSIAFNFASFNDTNNHPALIDLYASVTVSTNPFPDGLLQTNEAQECETNSYNPNINFCQNAIAMVQLQEPSLLIRKKVYCAGGCNQPACGTGCPSPGVVTHTTVANLGSASGNADANDIVTFVVSLENVGSGPNGAYDVKVSDNIGSIPGTIINSSFCVRRGDTTLLLSGTDYTLSTLTTSWTLNLNNLPLGSIPSLNAATMVSGANIILIFFSVKLNPPSGVTVGGICPPNTATLQRYSNMIGGQNFVGAPGLPVVLPVTATICTQLNPVKHIHSTSEADPSNPNVTIGNLVRYELSVDVPEGNVPAMTISDTLPTNLKIQGPAMLATPGMSPQPPPLVALSGIVPNVGTPNQPKFQIPAFVNAENDAACERLLITFEALVMNTVTNAAGQPKVNKFSVQFGSQPAITSRGVSVTIVEPKLKVTKDVVYGQSGTGHVALYTITIANISNATAFDVTIKETLPACVTAPTNPVLTAPIPAGVTLAGNFSSGFTLSPGLKLGETATIKFQVSVPETCTECATLKNSVHVEWTSEPGPQGTANATPGASCAPNGERCGHGLAVNSYHDDASASICGKVCGVKFADLDGDGVRGPNDPPLAGWPIGATGTGISTTTDANGHYCLDLVPRLPVGPYQICEATGVANWMPRTPTCVLSTVTANTTNPQPVDFGNLPACWVKLCGKKTGPPPASLPLGGWTITASGNGPVVTATTQPDGSYCMILFGTGIYTITETPQLGWLQLLPTSGSYNVHVDCKNIGGVPVAIVSDANGVVNPKVDFVNQNLCANPNFCVSGSHCEVGPNNTAICVSDINKKN